jgi:hypothetical protein
MMSLAATVQHCAAATTNSEHKVSIDLQDYDKLYKAAYLNDAEAEHNKRKDELETDAAKQERDLEHKWRTRIKRQTEDEKRSTIFPNNWELLDLKVDARYNSSKPSENVAGAVAASFIARIEVFEDTWSSVPITGAQDILTDWRICRIGANGLTTGIKRGCSNTILYRQIKNGTWHMSTNVSGIYEVSYKVHSHVQLSKRNLQSVTLTSTHLLSDAVLHIDHPRTSFVSELSVSSGMVDLVRSNNTNDEEQQTHLVMRVAPTRALQLSFRVRGDEPPPNHKSAKWDEGCEAGRNRSASAADGDSAAEEERGQTAEDDRGQTTVVHEVLHSIEDGILHSQHTFTYNVDTDRPTKSLAIAFVHGSGQVRITSVAGGDIQRWQSNAVSGATLSHRAAEVNATTLTVYYGNSLVTDVIQILVSTESEPDHAYGGGEVHSLQLPVVVCSDVLRQTGRLGVVKVANVEVHEEEVHGVVRTDANLLSDQLRLQTARPIFLSYKYLHPDHSVRLALLQHSEMPTLEAAIDSAVYRKLVLGAEAMHSLLLNIRNSKQQYLEVSNLPSNFTIWGLAVNSVPTKPMHSRREGTLLIPLLAAVQNNNDGKPSLSSVELSYLTHHTPLAVRLAASASSSDAYGSLDVSPPIFDIPVSVLNVELQLPDCYAANFSRECNLPVQNCRSLAQHLPKPISRSKAKTVTQRGIFDESASYAIEDQAAAGSVQVQMPSAGRMYCFQKLLVTGAAAQCTMDYRLSDAPKAPNRGGGTWWGWVAQRAEALLAHH